MNTTVVNATLPPAQQAQASPVVRALRSVIRDAAMVVFTLVACVTAVLWVPPLVAAASRSGRRGAEKGRYRPGMID